MVKILSQWILFPLGLLVTFAALIWAFQHPIVIVLTISIAALIYWALGFFIPQSTLRQKSLK